jgi:hypothetical protein
MQAVVSDPQASVATRIVRELLPSLPTGGRHRRPLPPGVVSRRGESLAAWARRLRPDAAAAIPALADVASALAALHGAGRVYHALKASDVVWLEGHRAWVLADFGATVRKGMLSWSCFACFSV